MIRVKIKKINRRNSMYSLGSGVDLLRYHHYDKQKECIYVEERIPSFDALILKLCLRGQMVCLLSHSIYIRW